MNIKRINDLMSEGRCTKSLARSAEIVWRTEGSRMCKQYKMWKLWKQSFFFRQLFNEVQRRQMRHRLSRICCIPCFKVAILGFAWFFVNTFAIVTMVTLQIQPKLFTQWWDILPACRGTLAWVAGFPLDSARDSRVPWAGKAARVRETTIASLAVVMKIGNAIVILIDVETEIGTEAVNTEKGDAGLKKV